MGGRSIFVWENGQMGDVVVKSVLAGVGLLGAGASWAGAAVVFQENFDFGNRPAGAGGTCG